jgi:HAD superfamily hydrolase (TIGR01509 family)
VTPRRFDAVIFDMDGTLVDSEPVQETLTRTMLAPYGIRWEEDGEFLGCTDLDMFKALVVRHGLADDAMTLTHRRAALMVELIGKGGAVVPMPGVPDVPQRLAARGYRLAVASSSALPIIDAVVDALGARALFGVLVSGLDMPRGKPAPDIFLETARQLGVPPARCLVIEDSRNGMLAAKAAGMACAAIPCAASHHQIFTEADWLLSSLTELETAACL